ncbi:hypothetical protein ACWEFJ_07235 [Actinosynnema sp. NPDC004786]
MDSHRAPGLVVSGLGLLVLVVFGVVVPTARAGGFAVDGTVVLLSLLVSAILLAVLGLRGKRGR